MCRNLQYKSDDLARFIGNVQYAVKALKNLNDDSELKEKIQILIEKVNLLEKEIDVAHITANKKKALDKITMYISRMLSDLDTERSDDPIQLMINDLTVIRNEVDKIQVFGDYILIFHKDGSVYLKHN